MNRYVARRLVESVITLFLATVVVFLGIRALPGDPARVLAGEESDPVAIAEVRASYGLDQPLPVQYVRYLGKRKELYGKVVGKLQEDAPLIYLYRQKNLTGLSSKVGQVKEFGDGIIRVTTAGFVE